MFDAARFVAAVVVTLLATTIAVDATGPVIVERAFIERDDHRHGEVRFVRDADCVRVQTLLYSSVLRRVVREIAVKEQAAWPAGSRFAADRELYVAAIDALRRSAETRPATDGTRRRLMLIELSRCGERRDARVGRMRLEGPPAAYEIVERLDESRLDVAPDWIDDRMRAIAADALGLDERVSLFADGTP